MNVPFVHSGTSTGDSPIKVTDPREDAVAPDDVDGDIPTTVADFVTSLSLMIPVLRRFFVDLAKLAPVVNPKSEPSSASAGVAATPIAKPNAANIEAKAPQLMPQLTCDVVAGWESY